MFERFTDKARHVVVLAQEEARGLQHNYIGTEHLLLGLFGEPDGIGARALAGFGLTLAKAREEVIARVDTGKKASPAGHIPFTPRSKKALELALREALALQHNYIGTEHLLLGLVREAEGVGAQVIAAYAPEPVAVRVRLAVLDLLPSTPAESGRRWFRRRGTSTEGDTESAQLDTTPAADAALSEAARLAGSERVGSQHLVLAALADPESVASQTLGALGLDLDLARVALQNADLTGSTDESPEEAGRRQLRLRVADTFASIEIRDPALVALARAAVDAVGDQTDEVGTIPGDLPVSTSLANVWRVLHDSLDDIRRRAGTGSEAQSPEPPEAA